MNADKATARFLELAASYDGVDAEHAPDRLGAVCAPRGPDWARKFFCMSAAQLAKLTPPAAPGANSSCLVFIVGVLIELLDELGLGLLDEPLDASGAVGLWARARLLALKHNALFSPERPGVGLRPGCIVHLESSLGRHWEGLLEDTGGGFWRLVAGGGVTPTGYQKIAIATHELAGGVFDRTSGKPVSDWIDVRTLLEGLLAETDPGDACVDGGA